MVYENKNKMINSVMLLRFYLFYLMGRTQTVGFQQKYEKYLIEDKDYLNIQYVKYFPMKVFRILNVIEKVNRDSQSSLKVYSDFECANIDSYQFDKKNRQFYFTIKGDTNNIRDIGDINWFFFGVQSDRCQTVNFSLLNLGSENMMKSKSIFIYEDCQWKLLQAYQKKSESQYTMYRATDRQEKFINQMNQMIRYQTQKQEVDVKMLRFEYEFQRMHQRVYFAMNLPYTFTNLINFISKQERTLLN